MPVDSLHVRRYSSKTICNDVRATLAEAFYELLVRLGLNNFIGRQMNRIVKLLSTAYEVLKVQDLYC